MRITINQPQGIYELGQRTNQEDNIWPLSGQATDNDRIFVLCDGMGGHEHGEVASRIVSQTIAEYLRQHANLDEIVEDQLLLDALQAAYTELDKADDGAAKKMGTTLCLLLFHRGGLTTMHIGDSRIYHVRPSTHSIHYQSKDHSLVYELYQAGEISYEEMATSPQKNIITRAIQPGLDNRVKPSIVHITDLRPGDYLYICSDGMLEQMDNDTLCQLFSAQTSDEEKRLQLIEATKGNKDNHSAYFLSIASVMAEQGDETLIDDEQTSNDNALNIRPHHQESYEDVEVVEPAMAQPVRGARTAEPVHRPGKKQGTNAKLILPIVLAFVVVVGALGAFFFMSNTKENAKESPRPATERLDTHPVSNPSQEPVSRKTVEKGRTPSAEKAPRNSRPAAPKTSQTSKDESAELAEKAKEQGGEEKAKGNESTSSSAVKGKEAHKDGAKTDWKSIQDHSNSSKSSKKQKEENNSKDQSSHSLPGEKAT